MSYTPVKGYWQGNAVANAPDMTKLTSEGFPANGDPSKGQAATIPGAAWYYWMDQAIRSVIVASGKTCANPPTADEFLTALKSLGWITNGSIDPAKINLASLVDTTLSATSTNPVQNKIVKSALDAKVAKAGDTMTGTLTVAQSKNSIDGGVATGMIQINANGNSGGGQIRLHGKSHSTNAGEVIIYVNNGTDSEKSLVMKPSGVMTWCGKEIVPVENTASAHNGIYRGANLAQWYTIEQLSAKVQAADWTNLFIGDYFDVTMTTSYKANETVRWQIAGFDTEWGHGDKGTVTTSTSDTKFEHHLAMLPRDCFDTYQKMNSTNTTEGGYQGSEMVTTVLPIYAEALKTAIGSSHVLTRRVLRSNAISTSVASGAYAGWTGASSAWAWVDESLGLLNEVQVYGTRVLSSSFYDVGNFDRQLPIFALGQDKLVTGPSITATQTEPFTAWSRYPWWLSSVASSTYFCDVRDYGYANYNSASNAYGVRPLFLFH